MSLIDIIKEHSIEARKLAVTEKTEFAKIKSSLLVTLFSEAAAIGKNSGNRASTDEETLKTVQAFLKNARATLESLQEGDPRMEGVRSEISILEGYLPQQYSREDIDRIIAACALNGDDMKLGSLMKFFKEHHNGKYDGKTLSEILRNNPMVTK